MQTGGDKAEYRASQKSVCAHLIISFYYEGLAFLVFFESVCEILLRNGLSQNLFHCRFVNNLIVVGQKVKKEEIRNLGKRTYRAEENLALDIDQNIRKFVHSLSTAVI